MLTSTLDAGSDQLGLKREGRFRTGLAQISSRKMLACPVTRIMRRLRSGPGPAILFLLLVPALANAAELKPETIQAWDAYIRARNSRMEGRANGHIPFLWVDENRDLVQRAKAGEILVEAVDGVSPHPVPGGLIHDWIGAMFIPKATLESVMGVLNDYKRYKEFYRPMVAKARVFDDTPEHEKVTLLMVQRAYSVTAAVETDNNVRFVRLDAGRAYSSNLSTHVREIADYGTSSEHALPEGHGPGYVWRMFTLTRLQQRDDGVYVEMEMAGLSRGIPVLFRWLVQPLAERLPRIILLAILKDTRDAVRQDFTSQEIK